MALSVSVITVCMNSEKVIGKTLGSVFQQTWSDLEKIVIDGASSDGTRDYLGKVKSEIDVLISEPDSGIYDAMNKGIRAASGDYLIFMNAGDRFACGDAIEKVMTHREVVSARPKIVSGRVQFEYGGKLTKSFRPGKAGKEGEGLPHQATFVNVPLHRDYPFDSRLRFVGDYELWRRLQHNGVFNVLYLDEVVAVFSLGGQSNTVKNDSKRYLERAFVDYQYSGSFTVRDWVRFLGMILLRRSLHAVLGERLYFEGLRLAKRL